MSKKKKIGIMTFHDGFNHGAYLQAFSTLNVLRDHGHDAKIIDYKAFKHWAWEYFHFLVVFSPKILYRNIRKILKFWKAHRKFIKTKFYSRAKSLQKEKFDTVVFGSDVIWDFENENFGKDLTYFGENINSDKLVAYAPSVGKLNAGTPVPDDVVACLKKFNHIAVRDENSKQTFQKYLDKEIKLVMDPTFLYDFPGLKNVKTPDNYILIYGSMLEDKYIKDIKSFAKKKNLKVIAIGYNHAWCDENHTHIGPFEWLSYIKNATYVVVASLHGTIFSIKYNKNFVVNFNYKIANKTSHYLNMFGLSDRVLKPGTDLLKLFENEIDYDHVNKVMADKKKESLDYLLSSV